MVESLLSPSNVLLYGRVLQDMTLDKSKLVIGNDAKTGTEIPGNKQGQNTIPPQPSKVGANFFLQQQLGAANAHLARIYGFSFEGHYYDLAQPAIFLVHGDGSDPEAFRPGLAIPDSRASRSPADADRTGIAYSDCSFSEDMRVWSYDKGDFSIRLDPMSGTFEDILLSCELGGDVAETSYAAAMVRGASARGASARGASLRGASARGASMRGASARLRGGGNTD